MNPPWENYGEVSARLDPRTPMLMERGHLASRCSHLQIITIISRTIDLDKTAAETNRAFGMRTHEKTHVNRHG
jgi:hypothetical protein